MVLHRYRGARFRSKKHGILFHDLEGAVVAVGGGGHVGHELCYVGPDAGYDAAADIGGDGTDEAGSRAELQAGFDAEAEDGGEDCVGPDEFYGEEFKVSAVAGG